MITGVSPAQIKTISKILGVITLGHMGLNIAKGQELGGVGSVLRGATGLNQKQLSESALKSGNIVYGEAGEEVGARLQDWMKLSATAVCPILAVPMMLWEGAECVDEIVRPDSYTTMGRMKDLLIDVPLSLATTVGIGALAFKGNFKGLGAVKKLMGLATEKKRLFKSFSTWSGRSGRKATNKMLRRKAEFKVASEAYNQTKASLLTSWGGWFDKTVMSNVRTFKGGMKPMASALKPASKGMAPAMA